MHGRRRAACLHRHCVSPPAASTHGCCVRRATVASQVWDTAALAMDAAAPAKLRVTAAVAAHDKDINAVAVAPNDSGTQGGGSLALPCGGWGGAADAAQKQGEGLGTVGDGRLMGGVQPSRSAADQAVRRADSCTHMPGVCTRARVLTAPLPPPPAAVICTGSQDRTAKVWQLPDLVLSLTLKGHKRGIWVVAFSPVDKAVATASGEPLGLGWQEVAANSCSRACAAGSKAAGASRRCLPCAAAPAALPPHAADAARPLCCACA